MSRATHSAIEILPAEAHDSTSIAASTSVEPSSIDLRQNDALRPGRPNESSHAPPGAKHAIKHQPALADMAPRSFAQVLFESDKFTAFKSGLMVTSNDWWTFTVLIGITVWSLITTTSRDTSTTPLGFALNTASTVARIVAFGLLWIVVGSSGALQHIDPTSTGRSATIRAFATAVAQGRFFPYALSLGSIVMSLNHGLKLLWFTTLESCLVAPTSLSPGACTPSTFSLPSDRVSVIFIIPIIAHVYLPSMRLSASLVSWLLGCICIVASYVRIGVFVDTLNLLTAAFVPVILFKFDTAVWSSFMLHEQTVLDAERALSAVERTRALERTILETEKANVESKSAELRSMMGNVAHDLKTPIQSIAMGVELLRSEMSSHAPSSPSTAESLGSAKLLDGMWAACEFMTTAINRSITFTKASADIALVPSLETVELAAPLGVSVNLIRILNPEVQLTVAPLPPDLCAHVVTDRHWLGENTLCLLSNAVKYSDGGPISVQVTLRAQNASSRMAALAGAAVSGITLSSLDSDASAQESDVRPATANSTRQCVRVAVIDSGIGVRIESRQHLFQPFGQTQRRAGGTGLGLYSLRKRMEALHGACGVSHRADGLRGSVFWFEFPYRPDESVAAAAAASSTHALLPPLAVTHESMRLFSHENSSGANASNAASARWAVRRSTCHGESKALRILLVEDSVFILKMATQILRKRGHAVETAANGSAGLDRLEAVCATDDDFDLVLVDFQMPVMDGFEMVRRYRMLEDALPAAASLQPRRAPMAIVGMSANSDLASQSLATEAGMNAFMPKPFSAADMQAILDLFDR